MRGSRRDLVRESAMGYRWQYLAFLWHDTAVRGRNCARSLLLGARREWGGVGGKRGRAREEMRPRGRMHAHLHEKARTHMNPQYANHERNQPEVPQLRVESQVGPVRGMYYTQRTHTRADLAAAAVASGTWRASSAPVAPCLAGGTASSLHARPRHCALEGASSLQIAAAR